MTGYSFGQKSVKELTGVHPALVAVVRKAITYSVVDFAVHDGLRTTAEQREYVARGASRTMASKHLPQPDGFGHAVDLVPYVNGKLRWEWGPIFHIAAAMRRAAAEEQLSLRWGAVWDRVFPLEFGSTHEDLAREVTAYSDRRRAAGKSAFLDGPHFELIA